MTSIDVFLCDRLPALKKQVYEKLEHLNPVLVFDYSHNFMTIHDIHADVKV